MPASAIAHVDVDAVLPLSEMATWLATHRSERPPFPRGSGGAAESPSPRIGEGPRDDAKGTRFTCSDCGGVLFEEEEAGVTRFRCSVGHVFSMESLAAGQAERLEGALWTAVRALEDRAELRTRMSKRAARSGTRRTAEGFRAQADEARARAALVREAAEQARPGALPDDESQAAS
jgi:two-component system chemotaxis response regulator CheB